MKYKNIIIKLRLPEIQLLAFRDVISEYDCD
jgi:hypothetical protein